MTQITIGDITATAELHVSDKSLAAQNRLQTLKSPLSGLIQAFSKPVVDPAFHSAKFGASFASPSLELNGNSLSFVPGVNSILAIARSSDTPLFGADDYDPIPIAPNECWRSFELDTSLNVKAAVPLPYGFGVCFREGTAPRFARYALIPASISGATTLRQAFEDAIGEFAILNTPDDVLAIGTGVVYTAELAGTVKVTGSWTLPLAVNQMSLANASLPFNAKLSVSPDLTVSVSGEIAISTQFKVRFRRIDDTHLRLALYKKHSEDFEASFTAEAGIEAIAGKTDLIDAVLSAVVPGIKTDTLQPDDVAKFQTVLNGCIDHSLAISLNAACSAATSDEAAFVYDVDVSSVNVATRQAIAEALHGNWSGIAKLPNAKKIRDVVTETLDRTFSFKVNLLGLYNYSSVSEFVKTMQVLRNFEDGAVVITDSATASRISTATASLAADGDRLRAALYQGFMATATYKALLAGLGTALELSAHQDLLIYQVSMNYRQALKQLKAAVVLGAMQPNAVAQLPETGSSVKHARFAANCSYSNEDVLRFFFSDISKLIPRSSNDLKRIGRTVLAQLLDPRDATDLKRIQTLTSDAQWAAMDKNPAQIQQPFRADWFDITEWAEALAKAGPLLADAIAYGKQVQGDPSADPAFQRKRAALAGALDGLTQKTRAAFDMSYPLCVMATLAAATSAPNQKAIFEAQWNSKTIVSNKPADVTRKLTATN